MMTVIGLLGVCAVLASLLGWKIAQVQKLRTETEGFKSLLQDRLDGEAGQIVSQRREISQLSNTLLQRQNELKAARDRVIEAEAKLEVIADETKFWVDDAMVLRWGSRPAAEEGDNDCVF